MEAIVFLNFDWTEKLEKKRGKVVKNHGDWRETLCRRDRYVNPVDELGEIWYLFLENPTRKMGGNLIFISRKSYWNYPRSSNMRVAADWPSCWKQNPKFDRNAPPKLTFTFHTLKYSFDHFELFFGYSLFFRVFLLYFPSSSSSWTSSSSSTSWTRLAKGKASHPD